jgi:hypothetical protein
MEIVEILNKIDVLIQKKKTGGVVENELEPLVLGLLDYTALITSGYHDRVKGLFKDISSIGKSTPFGYWFYKNLKDTRLPFSCEVFEDAVYNEKYYNLHGVALAGYLITRLRNYGIDNGNLERYIFEGDVEPIMPKHKDIKDDHIRDALMFAVREYGPPIGLNVALCGAICFDIPEVNSVLEEILRRNITDMEIFCRPQDQKAYYSTKLDDTADIALALFKLTKKKNYSRINDILKDEYKQMIKAASGNITNYHLEYSKVNEELKNLITS